jgi:protein-S-isoprenylcysteine O-methyltransferase
MRPPTPQLLGIAYLASEILLTVTRRGSGRGVKQDRSTLAILWVVISISVVAAVLIASRVELGAIAHHVLCRWLGAIIFAAGIALRCWAIVTLGRFFTVDVQIEADHELVERGPFRVVRHPSYSGILLAFLGFGLSLANWIALVVLLVPIFIAFVRRMNVEEDALRGALGDAYANYVARTRRIIPGIY